MSVNTAIKPEYRGFSLGGGPRLLTSFVLKETHSNTPAIGLSPQADAFIYFQTVCIEFQN